MRYILNKNAQIGTGYHKIHTKYCSKKPKKENIIDLKECMCPTEARVRAQEYFKEVNGCKYCCKEIYFNK